ncbi:MAG: hypothetical protein COB59_00940 [Rhodospirillaceae bacterium]|nr:MAG: hypothetical protein COB59_00940 [Rhodospirillaceae bacterium]
MRTRRIVVCPNVIYCLARLSQRLGFTRAASKDSRGDLPAWTCAFTKEPDVNIKNSAKVEYKQCILHFPKAPKT